MLPMVRYKIGRYNFVLDYRARDGEQRRLHFLCTFCYISYLALRLGKKAENFYTIGINAKFKKY